MKLGRNELCWCGSNKKYKKCHLNRETQPRKKIQDVLEQRDKLKEKYCLHPKASEDICNQIIQAHSIQKSNILESIARAGHVYQFSAEFSDLQKSNGRLIPKLIGINKASTFTGFCSYHDDETFKPIETNPIQINNEHIFLIAYRALCKELYAKKFQYKTLDLVREGDRSYNIGEQKEFQDFVNVYTSGVNAGFNDLMNSKEFYDEYLLTQNFNEVLYYVIEIDCKPEVLCSGQIHVEIDFNGNALYSPEEIADFSKKLDRISFSILTKNLKGLVIFSCFRNELKSIEFINSIVKLTDDELPNAIIRFTFEFFENTYMNPDWWEKLPTDTKESIIERMNKSVDFIERSQIALRDDGFKYVDWKVLNKVKNF